MNNPYKAGVIAAIVPFVVLFLLSLLFQFAPNTKPDGNFWYMLGVIINVVWFRGLLRNVDTEKSGKVVLVITVIWTVLILISLRDSI